MSESSQELIFKMGVTKEKENEINSIRDEIIESVSKWVMEPFSQNRKDKLHELEFRAQQCWGFPKDCGYHRYANEYEFKCGWVGRVFQCNETGEKVTIPFGVKECNYFKVGNGAVDVGRLNAYCRIIGNVIEIKEDI